MDCPACAHTNSAAANFCEQCGVRLERQCGDCGNRLSAQAKFCSECGTPTTSAVAATSTRAPAAPIERNPRDYTPRHLAERILSSRSAMEGERKHVTVMFADIHGSMAMSEGVDAEDWHQVMDRFFSIMTDGVHRFEGTINQYTGDGVMALFGAPIAHEDHAHRACFAALYLQDELRAYANELRVARGVPIAVRIGLNSGDVVVGRIGDDLRMDYTAQGHTVGLAARMQQIAEPGRTCVTGSTERLARGYFELENLGATVVKGVSAPIDVSVLAGVGSMRSRLDVSRSRGFSKFVGRTAELDMIERSLEQVLDGNGQLVGVVADAGTGKSRLCLEFLNRVRERGIRVYETRCLPHGRALPMYPALQLYRSVFGLEDSDTPERARDKIAGRMVLLDESLVASLPLLFDFLGVPDPERPVPPTDTEVRLLRIVEILRRVTLARSEREPIVVLVEDLHWIDPGSSVFFDKLIDVIPSGRVLLLANFRPEYAGSWGQKSYYRQIPLTPLGDAEISALLDHLLGRDSSLMELRERIAGRTGGNPFFVEEVVRELAELKHIEGEVGSYRMVSPIDNIPVPDSVQGVLAARIDRLHDDSKRLLQAAAVVGRTFTRSLLIQISGDTAERIDASLAALVADEFIYPEALYPEPEYSFRHALTRDVAYGSLLGDRRKSIHTAIASQLELLVNNSDDDRSALVAHHFEQGGEDLQAATWHERAAFWNGLRNAGESFEHWRKARQLLAKVTPTPSVQSRRVIACCNEIARGLRSGADLDPAALLDEARGQLTGCDDPMAEVRVLSTSGNIVYLQGDFHTAFPLLDRALGKARAQGDEYDVSAMMPPWLVIQTWRDPAAALALMDALPDVDIRGASAAMGFQCHGRSRIWRATGATFLGDYAGAIAAADIALDAAQQGEDAIDIALTGSICSMIYGMWGDQSRCLSLLREARRRAEASGVRMAVATTNMMYTQSMEVDGVGCPVAELRGSVEILAQTAFGFQMPALTLGRAQLAWAEGDVSAALNAIRQTRETLFGAGMLAAEPMALFFEAQILLEHNPNGPRSKVISLVARMQELIDRIGITFYQPYVERINAQLALAEGDHTAARSCLERAQHLFTTMGAPIPEPFKSQQKLKTVR